MRASLVIVLGLLLLVVAIVLLAMKTAAATNSRSTSSGSCQEGTSVDGRTECNALRRGLHVRLSADGYWWSGAPRFGIGKIWQILGLGKDKTPERVRRPGTSPAGGSFGALKNRNAKEMGDCRPLFEGAKITAGVEHGGGACMVADASKAAGGSPRSWLRRR